MAEELISARNIQVVYLTAEGGSLEAVTGVDLTVDAGEFVSIIGPSGCGKSTLLHVIGGLQPATGGTISIAGSLVRGPMPDLMAFVFQDYSLYPWRSVLKNVEIGLQFRGVLPAERTETARRYLEMVGLKGFINAYPRELSGGMQQRVAVARALSMEPRILLMDEPFGALDEQTRMVLGEELSRILEETGKTILFVTHSLSEAVFLSDRIVVISARPGRIKEILTVDEPRPRLPEFTTTDRFSRLRNRLYRLLYDEIRAATLQELRRDGG